MLAMGAETLNCPMCGASVATDSSQCRYCEARLATVACPSCFAMMFLGSKHCARCGAAAEEPKVVASTDKKCPRCKGELRIKLLGDQTLLECPDCLGLWLDVQTFEKICADWERQAAVLGDASLAAPHSFPSKVSYVPCPECKDLMNRANFARCSGVIVDLCKRHGIWFDCDELSRIIEFIKAGGLDEARAKEKVQLEEERRRLEQLKSEVQQRSEVSEFFDTERRKIGIASAGGLLKFFLK